MTFVLGHDTHGHAEATTTGCSGVLPTDAGGRLARRQRVRRDQRVVHRPRRRRRRSGADDRRPAPDPPEAAGGRERPQPVRHEHRRPDRRRRRPPARQPQRGRLDRAQRPVQPAQHQRDHVPGHGRHRRRPRPGRSRSGAMRSMPRAAARSCRATTITGTAAGTYASQTFPLANPGGYHRLFLVFANANTLQPQLGRVRRRGRRHLGRRGRRRSRGGAPAPLVLTPT